MRLFSMSLRLTLWLFSSLVSLAPLASAQPIFTVNSASDTDDGVCNPSHCSLREAIVAANAELGSGPQIHFAIPGDGVHSIAPTAPLPALTHSSVIVDGWTQPGASCASWPPALRIELDGTNAGMSNGLVIAAPNAEVRGLVINRFAEAGVRIENSGSGIFVECNFIGTDPTGTLALANGLGVEVVTTNYATVGNRNNTRLGNLISGNTGVGVHVDTESGGIQIRGNSIGTDVTGLAALGNLQGVLLEHKNSVGTSDPAFANLISGNIESGIVIRGAAASESGVYGNDIGLDALGLPTLGNGGAGISIEQGASKCQIGWDLGLDNRIADNGGGGVVVSGSDSIENLISHNSMEGNTGPGINLLGAPFDDPNDAGDPDEGPNRLQNTPVLLSAERPIDRPERPGCRLFGGHRSVECGLPAGDRVLPRRRGRHRGRRLSRLRLVRRRRSRRRAGRLQDRGDRAAGGRRSPPPEDRRDGARLHHAAVRWDRRQHVGVLGARDGPGAGSRPRRARCARDARRAATTPQQSPVARLTSPGSSACLPTGIHLVVGGPPRSGANT